VAGVNGLAPARGVRWAILLVVGGVFAIPLVAMLEFSLRNTTDDTHDATHWAALVDPATSAQYAPIQQGLVASLELVVLTVLLVLVLLTPTLILVRLRFPRLVRVLEFVCLLPITIPAIVLVVGLAPVYQVIGRTFGPESWTLAFAYGVLVLPYAYRAIAANLDAIDARTLAEAARSLGASWPRVLLTVLVPNLRVGLLAAALISTAAVLGEFTIASLLNRVNLQTALYLVSQQDPYVAVALSLLSLVLGFVLLTVLGRIGGVRPVATAPAPRRNRDGS
jgi:putative spermidine/putrescine transport system permease protein